MMEKVALSSRKSLASYSKLMWPIVEPKNIYSHNFHIDVICEHLEAVTRGEIRNLIINIPPRHMKSLLCCVFWQTWTWIDWPESRWLFSSYAESLSKRDSIKCRRIIESDLYQRLFNPEWSLSHDQNEKMRFENDKTGYRLATSVGGAGTGEGGDFIVCDDPHKATQVHSPTRRESVIEWWREEMSSRGNDPKTVRKVIVMQRLHEKDLAGDLLVDGDWMHLMLPAKYEPKRTISTPLFKDPRKEEGELLWPDRMPLIELDKMAKEMGSMAAQGQLQQNPVPDSGGLFKRQWWKFYTQAPPRNGKRVIQFWDCAQKTGISNDYSVCATWMNTGTGFYLLDLWRNKVEAPQLEIAVQTNYNKWQPDTVVIEDKSSGSSLIQAMRQKTTLPIIPYNPKYEKEVRAISATPTVESGNCYLPNDAPWVEDYIQEHERFPLAEHDDQVDTTSMMVEFFNMLSNSHPRIRRL